MSSFGDGLHSLEHILSLLTVVESPKVRSSPSDSKGEDALFRVARGPRRVGSPSILVVPPPPTPLSLDLAGPSGTVSMMTRTDALHL